MDKVVAPKLLFVQEHELPGTDAVRVHGTIRRLGWIPVDDVPLGAPPDSLARFIKTKKGKLRRALLRHRRGTRGYYLWEYKLAGDK